MNKVFAGLDTIMFMNVSDLWKTLKVSSKVVEKNPMMFKFVHNHFKT